MLYVDPRTWKSKQPTKKSIMTQQKKHDLTVGRINIFILSLISEPMKCFVRMGKLRRNLNRIYLDVDVANGEKGLLCKENQATAKQDRLKSSR